MILDEIRKRLDDERDVASRFPVRVIFTETMEDYEKILSELSGKCHVTIKLSECCSGEDLLPRFATLSSKIQAHSDAFILLLGVWEYLRLCMKRELRVEEALIPDLWRSMQDTASRRKIFIPMLRCREQWDRLFPVVSERREDHLWTLSGEVFNLQEFSLTIFSEEFQKVVLSDVAGVSLRGIQHWLDFGFSVMKQHEGKCSIVTKFWKYAEPVDSSFTVNIIKDPFSYVREILKDGASLEEKWGTQEEWLSLVGGIRPAMSLREAIKKELNVRDFAPRHLLQVWSTLDNAQRWLFWLWYRVNSSEDYWGYAIKRSSSYKKIPDLVEKSIFDVLAAHPEWIAQRREVIGALKKDGPSQDFFAALEEIPDLKMRLSLLSDRSQREKTYAIRVISTLLRGGNDPENLAKEIEQLYPLLSCYMRKSRRYSSPKVEEYYAWYRKHKLMNSLPEHSEERLQALPLSCFDTRFSALKKFEKKHAFLLWVDGMGAEWLPVLCERIEKWISSLGELDSSSAVRAILPTETMYNNRWDEVGLEHYKINSLDDLAHKGMPDDKNYFSCIAHQLEKIDDVAKGAVEKLKNYDYVIVTADHGTSRLAALAFHDISGITAPSGTAVRSYGRYCEILDSKKSSLSPGGSYPDRVLEKEKFIVFTTYNHYVQPGNAAGKNDDVHATVGEVHGGGTPEEVLVPVVVLKRKEPIKINFVLQEREVYRVGDEVSLKVVANKPVSRLKAYALDFSAQVSSSEDGKTWRLSFRGLPPGVHALILNVDGRPVERGCTFKVKTKGITQNNDFFGDM